MSPETRQPRIDPEVSAEVDEAFNRSASFEKPITGEEAKAAVEKLGTGNNPLTAQEQETGQALKTAFEEFEQPGEKAKKIAAAREKATNIALSEEDDKEYEKRRAEGRG